MNGVFWQIKKYSPKRLIYASTAGVKALVFLFFITWLYSFELVHLGALASSSFAAFCSPTLKTAKTEHLIGSYIVALVIGMIFSSIDMLPIMRHFPPHLYFFTALAVGLTITILVLLSLEHPPSAGISVSFLIHPWTWVTPLALFSAVILLVLFRKATVMWAKFFREPQG